MEEQPEPQLLKEADNLKRKLEEEKAKLNDGESMAFYILLHIIVTFMSEHFDSIPSVNIKVRRVLKGHQGKVLSLAWSLDKRHVVSSSQVILYYIIPFILQDGKLFVWDAFTSTKEYCISMPTTWVMTCTFSPSNSFVACGYVL